ncbi:hypothetical protein PsYK624_066320 [Phanerochaete sordida]|uniref:DUF6535 domain-containing protein n=1 Tax=Phanerochaete sordida TaxID=48140 RepID=A0A9P3G9W8_9APHY|nr:hypothetical protein PsYK624_066320 [Phanerochaete sordida]
MPDPTEECSTGHVRYVEVQPQNGWQTMAKSVRDIDLEKIQDYKEDIDTLLVFAGLYSAVLSAFLIESYTSLFPDNESQMVYLLQRIAVQTSSYTITAGFLNATAQIPDLPPSGTPAWAIQVNGLWFASLILSLAVASYGMLVKQWLREYLAMEWTAPQEKLRARRYRKPSLEKWKVFEIAAALPLILQLSLGLFFLGLCMFTTSASKEITRTTIPLVCGWAMCFVFATLAPLLSPRCPFKTPFLKGSLKAARIYCTRPLLNIASTIAQHYTRNLSFELQLSDEEDVVVAHDQDDATILLSTDAYMADDTFLSAICDTYKNASSHPESRISFAMSMIYNRLGGEPWKTSLDFIPDLSSLSRRAYTTILDFVADTILPSLALNSSLNSSWQRDACLLLLAKSSYPLSDRARNVRQRIIVGNSAETPQAIIENVISWIKHDHYHEDTCIHLGNIMRDCGQLSHTSELLRFYYSIFVGLDKECFKHRPKSLYVALSQNPLVLQSQYIIPVLGHLIRRILDTELQLGDRPVMRGFLDMSLHEAIILALDFAEPALEHDEVLSLFRRWWICESTSSLLLVHGFCIPCQLQVQHNGVLSEKSASHRVEMLSEVYRHSDLQTKQQLLQRMTNVILDSTSSRTLSPNQPPMDILRCCWLHLRILVRDAYHQRAKLTRLAPMEPTAHGSSSSSQSLSSDYVTSAPDVGRGHVSSEDADNLSKEWKGLLNAVCTRLKMYYREKSWENSYPRPEFMDEMPGNMALAPEQIIEDDRLIAADCLDLVAKITVNHLPTFNAVVPHDLIVALGLVPSVHNVHVPLASLRRSLAAARAAPRQRIAASVGAGGPVTSGSCPAPARSTTQSLSRRTSREPMFPPGLGECHTPSQASSDSADPTDPWTELAGQRPSP